MDCVPTPPVLVDEPPVPRPPSTDRTRAPQTVAQRSARPERFAVASKRGSLAALGLSGEAEALYRTMCSRRGDVLSAIAADAGLSSDDAAKALRHLRSLGLIGDIPADGQTVSPVAPDVAIERLLQHKQMSLLAQQHQLLEVREDLDDLKRSFQQEWRLSDPTQPVQLLTGVDVAAHTASLGILAEFEFACFVDARADPPWEGELPEPPRQGVRNRRLYSRDALLVPELAARAHGGADTSEEARVTVDLPIRLILVDDRIALVPLAPVASSGSLLIRSRLLIGALWELFESAWDRAVPISGAVPQPQDVTGATDEDRVLIQLMAAGLKDEAIARRLGVAERTIGRRIGALMVELNASTRFQAGMQAARRGWLT